MPTTEDDLVLVSRLFRQVPFRNKDIGPLNDSLNLDCFVISSPKCGTTAIQRGLERLNHKVIHAHNNPTTYEAVTNGDVLRARGVGLETVLKARLLASARPLHLFFGYREPVDWYLSMAGHFFLPLDATLRDGIVENIETRHPWTKYRMDDTATIVREATGLDILSQGFDHKVGCTVTRNGKINLICYRFDRIESVRDYIVDNIDRSFVLTHERTNNDPGYNSYKVRFSPSIDHLEHLYCNKWFQHYYLPTEMDALIEAYRQRARSDA